ncbi:MAG: phage recombination protein Bet [Atopobiaceae bacterium]|nr:phage recombination protein Bet [Atopobiaceae bacterium]
MPNEMVKYELDNGQAIQVTEQDVRDLLAAGGQIADNVTANEIKAFLRLCQAQRLNPFTRDAYIVKYGSSPATIITGKEAFTKRAFRNKKFKGMEAGITVYSNDALQRRDGSLLLPGEQLVGGWCKVYVDGYATPMFDEVSFSEYSTGKSNWTRIPATMIRKVAITHALREAFPEDLGGLYGEEEMEQAVDPDPTPAQAVVTESATVQPTKPERPARLEALRQLFKEAKAEGILIQDKQDPDAGLMGWIHAKYGCEPDELGDEQIAECEAYVRQVIADKRIERQVIAYKRSMSAPQPEIPDGYELAEFDIDF